MIELTNTTAQTLEAGQAITFDKVLLKTGCGECHRASTSSVKLRSRGIYMVSFGGNIGGATAGTAVQLSIALGGDILADGTVISTSAAANDLNAVSRTLPVQNTCGDYDRVTVVNTGTTTVTVGAGSVLFVRRVA